MSPDKKDRALTKKLEKSDFETSPNIVIGVMSEEWKKLRDAEYKQYRLDWDRVPKDKVFLDFPLHLDIETTTRCNLKCPMCPRTLLVEEGKFEDYGFISREDYKKIIDEGVRHGVKAIKLNYLGEPLLHKDVVWQVAYAKEQGILDVMMNSNGSALTEKNSRDLLDAGLDNMFISIDAVNPADYAVQRVGTTLGRVIDNTYNFIQLRNELRPSCQVRLSMVMYDDPKWQRQYEALKIMWEGLADGVNINKYTERAPDAQHEFDERPGFHCAMPFQRMFLKYNGNVTVCCIDDRDEIVMGNWRDEKLHDIWNSDAYNAFRRTQADNKYYDVEMCRRCPLPKMME